MAPTRGMHSADDNRVSEAGGRVTRRGSEGTWGVDETEERYNRVGKCAWASEVDGLSVGIASKVILERSWNGVSFA